MGNKKGAYRFLVGKLERQRPLERPKCRWEGFIEMDLQEVGWRGMDWIDLAQDRDKQWAPVNVVTNLWVPQNVGSCLTS
jgi:hypothetical protein